MTILSKRKKWSLAILSVATTVTLIVIAVLAGARLVNETFRKDYERYGVVKIGMTDEEVVNLLGSPYRVYDKATAPRDYYIDGYAHENREINNKVFIYISTEPIAYIYFDGENKVEDIFIGGS